MTSSVEIGDVEGGIHRSKIAGRDIIEIGEFKIDIVPIESALGQRLPERNLPALRATLEQALPHLAGAQQAATQAAIEKLEQLIAALPRHERTYLERVHQRFARPETIFVELEADTYEQPGPAAIDPEALDLAAVAELMRQRETMPELEELQRHGREIKWVRLPSLAEAIARYACIILLGDPGCGKTTALNHLAYELAEAGQGRESPKLPLLLRLSEFGSTDRTVEAFIDRSWRGSLDSSHWSAPALADNLAGYLAEGRLLILFDALNEMPMLAAGFKQRAAALRDFIEQWQKTGNRFVVTCRVLDYEQELQGLQRVEVQPFNDDQIRTFLQKVLHRQWPKMLTTLTGGSGEAHRLLAMARNPYMLTMMVSEFVRGRGYISVNRAELMTRFTETLLAWAKRKPHLAPIWLDEAVQREALSLIAFEMQRRRGAGAAMATRHVKKFIPAEIQTDPDCPADPIPNPDDILTLAAGSNIIEMPVDRSRVRFYHQLFHEYFAAHKLRHELSKGHDLRLYWPSEHWWKASGWEETIIILAGLVSNVSSFLEKLTPINPILASHCLLDAGVQATEATKHGIITDLIVRMTDVKESPQARPLAGRALARLGDPRGGVGLSEDGLPDILWCEIPAGPFMRGSNDYVTERGRLARYYGDERPQQEVYLSDYRISRFPITNSQYNAFVRDDGYQKIDYWRAAAKAGYWKDGKVKIIFYSDEELSERWDDRPPDYYGFPYHLLNHPIVGITWYEAVAFCSWLTVRLRQKEVLNEDEVIGLPTENQWEKAARGPATSRRVYPWGNTPNPNHANFSETGIGTTTAVGCFPNGASPYGVEDMAGNVWEWCQTRFHASYDSYYLDENDNEKVEKRVVRGGSFSYDKDKICCSVRSWYFPFTRYLEQGFRITLSKLL